MGKYNPNRTRNVLIGIRTEDKHKEVFDNITKKLGKTNGETFDIMVDLTNLLLNNERISMADMKEVLEDDK